MTTPFTTCEEGFQQFNFQRNRISCSFYALGQQLETADELKPKLSGMSNEEVLALGREYSCFSLNEWRFRGLCESQSGSSENALATKVNAALAVINVELSNRNLDRQDGSGNPSALEIFGCIAGGLLLLVLVIGGYQLWKRRNGDEDEELVVVEV